MTYDVHEIQQQLQEFVVQQVAGNPGNRDPDGMPWFEGVLLGFAAGDDPLFTLYRKVVGPFHRPPREWLEDVGASPGTTASVISWVLPVAAPARLSNRSQRRWPSRRWAETRTHGEAFNVALRRAVVGWLQERGGIAVAPQLSSAWREIREAGQGPASTWSERHAAYAAGLGTFSLNDGLITHHGIAHRCGSVITDVPFRATPRPYQGPRDWCLFHARGTCAACVRRCPAGALSTRGHDKRRCSAYVYTTAQERWAKPYGVAVTGCGLCQTAVPCEQRNPVGTVPPGDRES